MALNVTESHDVNTLLHHLLGDAAGLHRKVTDDDVLQAAARLADGAYRKLSAGITSDQVRQAWPNRRR